MVISCMAPGCSNRGKQNDISFHRLTIKDSTTLQKWLNNMKLKKPPNLKYSRLCSKHFTEDCYERDLKSELLGFKKQNLVVYYYFNSCITKYKAFAVILFGLIDGNRALSNQVS